MTELIFDVIIPEETIVEKKVNSKGEEETVEKIKKIFPGYVFVHMIITDESWHVIRNTPQVTGFLGSSGGRTKPVPVETEEMNKILLNIGVIELPKFKYNIGDVVEIADVYKRQGIYRVKRKLSEQLKEEDKNLLIKK